MALQPRPKLVLACALLAGSMLPLLVEPTWEGVRATRSAGFVIALVTGGLALWGAFAGRAAWVLLLTRAGLQALAMLLLFASVESDARHAGFLHMQAAVSLGLTVAALWLLGSQSVRSLVWSAPEAAAGETAEPVRRPPSRIATAGVLGGFGTCAVLLGSVEQAWIYQHLSLLELGLRSLYLVLPWVGAWQLAKLGRDRVLLTTMGALLGELFSEFVSLMASGADVATAVGHLLLPLANLPVVVVGLALAVFGPRRPLWQLGIVLPLAQLLYRAAAVWITSEGGMLSWQAAVLAVLGGVGLACSVYLFRRADEEEAPAVPAPTA